MQLLATSCSFRYNRFVQNNLLDVFAESPLVCNATHFKLMGVMVGIIITTNQLVVLEKLPRSQFHYRLRSEESYQNQQFVTHLSSTGI